MMILDRIVEVKKEEVALLARTYDQSKVDAEIAGLAPTRGFAAALTGTKELIGLIAEVKKASPSKGLIRTNFDPVAIAQTYANAGASCISVLTDRDFFQGHPSFLRNIRTVVDIPLLRKDFIIDEKQVYEARVLGADCILLITAILSTEQLKEYSEIARRIGLDVLVEVHDDKELVRALDAGAPLLGINNRDLRDFSVDLGTTARLAQMVPEGTVLVSESGIVTHGDVQTVKQAGAHAILVGETLMRDPQITPAIDLLLGRVTA
jgi:indole-3-glycerol phosphate synthase